MVNTNFKKEPKKGREEHFWQRISFIYMKCSSAETFHILCHAH